MGSFAPRSARLRGRHITLPVGVVVTVDVLAAGGVRAGPAPVVGRRFAPFDPCVITTGLLVFAVVLFMPSVLGDVDTFWHIATGAWILDHRAIPGTDPFSFTAGDRPWLTIEWLSQTLMALAFRAGGMQGVMALTAGAAGLTAALLLQHLRRFLPGSYALVGVSVALVNALPSLLARPHLLAWPCLVLWCGGLALARANRVAPSFRLLPVMLLWVNLHGSSMLGLLLAGAFMLEAVLEAAGERRRVFRSWAGFVLAAWAVALLTPNFIAGALFPFRVISMQSNLWISEWQPPSFSGVGPLELTLLGGLALGFCGRVRLPPMRLLLLLGLVHCALAHRRDAQLLGLVGAVILAEPLGAALARGGAAATGAAWRRLVGVAGVVAAAALCGRMAMALPAGCSGAAFAEVLERVPPAVRAAPVLNAYDYGGPLIFNGVRPFIDGRAADLYGDAFMARYIRILGADRGVVARVLSEYGIVWSIFPADAPVVRALEQEPGWVRLVAADGVVVDVRQDRLPR